MDEATQNALKQLDELEETVRRVADELASLRARCETATAEAERLRAALDERGKTVRELERRLLDLQAERAEARHRVAQLVAKIDSVTEEEP